MRLLYEHLWTVLWLAIDLHLQLRPMILRFGNGDGAVTKSKSTTVVETTAVSYRSQPRRDTRREDEWYVGRN